MRLASVSIFESKEKQTKPVVITITVKFDYATYSILKKSYIAASNYTIC